MTSLEGRVLRRRRALDAAGRVRAASWRSWPTWPRGSAARCRFDTRRRLRSSTSSRGPAPVAGPTTPASATRASTPSEARPLALAGAGRAPGRRGCSPTRFAHADGRARMVAGRRRRTGRRPARRRAGLPRHRPGAGAVPVRRADPPGRRAATAPRPSPSSSCTRSWPRGSASSDGDDGRGDLVARHARSHRPGSPRPSGPDTVFMPFHWAGEALANARHQRRHRPGLRDAGVQGVRGLRRAAPIAASSLEEVRMSTVRAGRRRRGRHGRPPVRRGAGPRATATDGSRSTWSARRRTSPTTGSCSPTCSPAARDVAALTLPRPPDRVGSAAGVARRRDRPRRRGWSQLDDGERARLRPPGAGHRRAARSCRRSPGWPSEPPAHVHVLRTSTTAATWSPARSTPGTRWCSAGACSASRPPAGWRAAAWRSRSCTSTPT